MHINWASVLLGAILPTLLVVADSPWITDENAYQSGTYGDAPLQTYQSTDVISPLFAVQTWNTSLMSAGPSMIFTSGLYGTKGSYAYIFNNTDLSLIYAGPSFSTVYDARPQVFNGTNYFVFYEGVVSGPMSAGHTVGNCLLYDGSYNLAYNLSTVNLGTGVDLHECQLTPDGTALVTAYVSTQYDLTSVGGVQNDTLLDSVFQEVDIATNDLVMEWRASWHFPVTASYQPYAETEGGWDPYHINSIQKTPEGNYLVSLRELRACTYIKPSGTPIWNLGGNINNFKSTATNSLVPTLDGDDPLSFGFQHHARFLDDTTLTDVHFFDNRGPPPTNTYQTCNSSTCSRGRHLSLDFNSMTVSLVKDYFSPSNLQSFALGSYIDLPNGNVLVGFGSQNAFTEYTQDGTVARDVQLAVFQNVVGKDASTYRFFQADWVGTPTYDPKVAVDTSNKTLYVSWNGATEVTSWAVMGSDDSSTLTYQSVTDISYALAAEGIVNDITSSENSPSRDGIESLTASSAGAGSNVVQTVAKAGFETTIGLDSSLQYVRIAGMNSAGQMLGMTALVDMSSGTIT